jgi:hypothetical protein
VRFEGSGGGEHLRETKRAQRVQGLLGGSHDFEQRALGVGDALERALTSFTAFLELTMTA